MPNWFYYASIHCSSPTSKLKTSLSSLRSDRNRNWRKFFLHADIEYFNLFSVSMHDQLLTICTGYLLLWPIDLRITLFYAANRRASTDTICIVVYMAPPARHGGEWWRGCVPPRPHHTNQPNSPITQINQCRDPRPTASNHHLVEELAEAEQFVVYTNLTTTRRPHWWAAVGSTSEHCLERWWWLIILHFTITTWAI